MLIITLLKGVPARTTKVVTVSGVLKREEMELVMNPHDYKALEAADYVKRTIGGKLIALTMGPDVKLSPIMRSLFDAPIEGIDEAYVLSDRRMAGADTLATAYTVAKGIVKLIELHSEPIKELIGKLDGGASVDEVMSRCKELYRANLLPNSVYSELPTVRNSAVASWARGEITRSMLIERLRSALEEIRRFIIMAGIKTTDGETGSTGPQVAEALSEMLGEVVPSLTYVKWFEIDEEGWKIVVERKLGDLYQKLRTSLPCLLTVSPEYKSSVPSISSRKRALLRNYRGKVRSVTVWNADQIGAELERIGLFGSPTIVGPGVDIGSPPVQKVVGLTKVCLEKVEKFELNGRTYGPFEKGTKVDDLPEDVVRYLEQRGVIGKFTLDMLIEEVFGVMKIAVKQ